jgi:MFS family permease
VLERVSGFWRCRHGVGFAERPRGAWIFGHFRDRIGRKSTLIVTLLLMGIATFLIGVMPTYSTLGVWAAWLLHTFNTGYAIAGYLALTGVISSVAAPMLGSRNLAAGAEQEMRQQTRTPAVEA